MGGVDVRERIRQLADQAWKGLDAQDEIWKLLREHPGDPGPTEVAELTDHFWRPEHISRILSEEAKPRRKQRRRTRPVVSRTRRKADADA